MPSFSDSIFLFVLALLLFGPKKLPVLARELGKWVGEFRRASNEFKMQMEDELRLSEQAEREQKIAAMEAAAPVRPAVDSTPALEAGAPSESISSVEPVEDPYALPPHPHETPQEPPPAPLPIATSGEMKIMPPATGLPEARGARSTNADALGGLLESIPVAHEEAATKPAGETAAHG